MVVVESSLQDVDRIKFNFEFKKLKSEQKMRMLRHEWSVCKNSEHVKSRRTNKGLLLLTA